MQPVYSGNRLFGVVIKLFEKEESRQYLIDGFLTEPKNILFTI
jgi:hypothetical protein